MPTPAQNEAYWRAKLAGQGSISKPTSTIGGILENGIRKAAHATGASERASARFAKRATKFINDATPVGNVTGAEEGAQTIKRGVTKGELGTSALGLASLILSVAPLPGGVKKPAKRGVAELIRDETGAIRAYHGGRAHSGDFDLSQAGSGLGYADEPAAWFTPDQFEANRYAWSVSPAQTYAGKAVYPATIDDVGFDDIPPMGYDPEEFARIIAQARAANRPGVIFRSVREDDRLSRPADQIAVLDPSRIKF